MNPELADRFLRFIIDLFFNELEEDVDRQAAILSEYVKLSKHIEVQTYSKMIHDTNELISELGKLEYEEFYQQLLAYVKNYEPEKEEPDQIQPHEEN